MVRHSGESKTDSIVELQSLKENLGLERFGRDGSGCEKG